MTPPPLAEDRSGCVLALTGPNHLLKAILHSPARYRAGIGIDGEAAALCRQDRRQAGERVCFHIAAEYPVHAAHRPLLDAHALAFDLRMGVLRLGIISLALIQ